MSLTTFMFETYDAQSPEEAFEKMRQFFFDKKSFVVVEKIIPAEGLDDSTKEFINKDPKGQMYHMIGKEDSRIDKASDPACCLEWEGRYIFFGWIHQEDTPEEALYHLMETKGEDWIKAEVERDKQEEMQITGQA